MYRREAGDTGGGGDTHKARYGHKQMLGWMRIAELHCRTH
jgi:hypothetical protein